jgi:hypothetical protein
MTKPRARRPAARPIPTAQLCDRYGKLYVAAITDVLDHLGRKTQTLPHDIVGLTPRARVAGLAFPPSAARRGGPIPSARSARS